MKVVFGALKVALGELRPMPDRLAGTLRITAASLITVIIMLTFRNKMIFIGPFLVFMVMQRSTLMTNILSVLLMPAMLITSLVLVGIEMVAWDTAWLRILLMGTLFWTGFWTMSRSPALGILAIFPMCLLSILIFDFDEYPDPNSILSQIGWIWAAVGIAICATLLVQKLSNTPTGMDVFRDDVRRLLGAAEESCISGMFGRASGKGRIASTMARDGDEILHSLAQLPKAKLLTPIQAGNCRSVIAAAQAVLAKSWEEKGVATAEFRELAKRVRCLRLRIGGRSVVSIPSTVDLPLLAEAERAVGLVPTLANHPSPTHHQLPSEEFNGAEFANRATLAAMACYFFASLTDWSGIHTCMITCVVTALSRIEAQTSKQFQRLLGASLGGILSLIGMIWVIPAFNTLFGILLTIGVGTAIAAWCSYGREKVSYVGLQMGLAFYLTVLQDPHATTNLDPLRDRLIGIFVGILAMRFFFTIPLPWHRSTRLVQTASLLQGDRMHRTA